MNHHQGSKIGFHKEKTIKEKITSPRQILTPKNEASRVFKKWLKEELKQWLR
jgi:hypothetical protein